MGINKKLLAGGANSRSTFTKCMYSMTDHKLKIKVSSCGKYFGCAWSDEKAGSVVATAKTLDELKEVFAESLKLHIEGCVADGDDIPLYLIDGDYELEYAQ